MAGPASVAFADYEDGVRAVRALSQSGLHPANCRLLDPVEALINAGSDTAVVVLGFESADHPLTPWMERALELCRDHGGALPEPARYTDADDESPRRRGRQMALGVPSDALPARRARRPRHDRRDLRDRVHLGPLPSAQGSGRDRRHDAMRQVGVEGVLTCRFTHVYPDGPAPYFGIYAAGRWGETVEQWDEIKTAVSEAILGRGGTITHHHAVGRDHRPWYDRQRPDLFAAALRAGKAVLDPAGILNPGALIDPLA